MTRKWSENFIWRNSTISNWINAKRWDCFYTISVRRVRTSFGWDLKINAAREYACGTSSRLRLPQCKGTHAMWCTRLTKWLHRFRQNWLLFSAATHWTRDPLTQSQFHVNHTQWIFYVICLNHRTTQHTCLVYGIFTWLFLDILFENTRRKIKSNAHTFKLIFNLKTPCISLTIDI